MDQLKANYESRIKSNDQSINTLSKIMINNEKVMIDFSHKGATTIIVASPLDGGRVYGFQQHFPDACDHG